MLVLPDIRSAKLATRSPPVRQNLLSFANICFKFAIILLFPVSFLQSARNCTSSPPETAIILLYYQIISVRQKLIFSPPELLSYFCTTRLFQSARNCYSVRQKLLPYYQITSVCQKLLLPVRQKLSSYYQITSVCQKVPLPVRQKLIPYYCTIKLLQSARN